MYLAAPVLDMSKPYNNLNAFPLFLRKLAYLHSLMHHDFFGFCRVFCICPLWYPELSIQTSLVCTKPSHTNSNATLQSYGYFFSLVNKVPPSVHREYTSQVNPMVMKCKDHREVQEQDQCGQELVRLQVYL